MCRQECSAGVAIAKYARNACFVAVYTNAFQRNATQTDYADCCVAIRSGAVVAFLSGMPRLGYTVKQAFRVGHGLRCIPAYTYPIPPGLLLF